MKTTIICNLHQVEYARAYAQRIIGIRNGKIDFDENIEFGIMIETPASVFLFDENTESVTTRQIQHIYEN